MTKKRKETEQQTDKRELLVVAMRSTSIDHYLPASWLHPCRRTWAWALRSCEWSHSSRPCPPCPRPSRSEFSWGLSLSASSGRPSQGRSVSRTWGRRSAGHVWAASRGRFCPPACSSSSASTSPGWCMSPTSPVRQYSNTNVIVTI